MSVPLLIGGEKHDNSLAKTAPGEQVTMLPPATDTLPMPLCGHERRPLARSSRVSCPECGSFWDRDALREEPRYDRSYPEQRSHFSPRIGRLKTKTLRRWIGKLGVATESLTICEVGFGGGFCLSYLKDAAESVVGVEAIPENIEHAVGLGLARESLYLAGSLPAVLPEKIDLWIFQDSFEHLEDPGRFLQWMSGTSSGSSRVLVVAPDGASLSARIMGGWWPHKGTDHRFHWTRKGMVDFFSRHDFVLENAFPPAKYVSLTMVFSHLALKRGGLKRLEPWVRRIPCSEHAFLFNLGEMGLLFRKR